MASNTIIFENNFFYEDEVFSLDKRGRVKFGLVMENFEGSASDNEDDFLNKGEIRVAWHPNGDEEIINERAVSTIYKIFFSLCVLYNKMEGKGWLFYNKKKNCVRCVNGTCVFIFDDFL